MKALVTGGAGFIGSHLTDALIERGDEVVVIDNLESGKRENLNDKAVFVEKDIRDDLNELFEKNRFDCVFHLAAVPRVQFSIKNPDKTHDVNVNGTVNLLEMCRKHDVKRFVSTSSSSVYGDQDKLPLNEEMKPGPMSPYALHKLIGEHYCKLYNFLYGLETLSLRYFNVYGERQDPEGAYACLIPKFTELFRSKGKPVINGDGEQTRDFTYVKDVVNANIAAALTENKEAFGEAFNIGAGNQVSVNDVSNGIKEILGSDVVVEHGPSVIEPKHTFADVSKAEKLLGWKPEMHFDEGLKRTVEWFNN